MKYWKISKSTKKKNWSIKKSNKISLKNYYLVTV